MNFASPGLVGNATIRVRHSIDTSLEAYLPTYLSHHQKDATKMLANLLSKIFAIPIQVFAGEIVNDQLNPLHLAVATTGYRIQSRTLQIPDRFGFFSSGPPRLQVHEGSFFIVTASWTCLNLIFHPFMFFLGCLYGLPNCRKLGAAFSLIVLVEFFCFWLLACCDRRRAPGYEWEDWKLRKD